VVQALGIDLFLKDLGKGLPTLFLHGNPDTADLWDGVTERLRVRFRCLAPDLPGFGRSGAGDELDCSLAGFARLVDEIVEAIGIREPLNLVVHDFGGPIGLSWAVENPRQVLGFRRRRSGWRPPPNTDLSGAIVGKDVYLTFWDATVTGKLLKGGKEILFVAQIQDPGNPGTRMTRPSDRVTPASGSRRSRDPGPTRATPGLRGAEDAARVGCLMGNLAPPGPPCSSKNRAE
jgi:pimeloyl-ACP methyl ester carboxylesterase